ncbi:unnamed protein product [Ambrosiozyma monospora]|uniref:Unnamed protein product n=1 Tax=Ambrosiozyma monospora TaxID=43982 RepID=A0ACB5UE21_AMBMO|nr:unnamed protein product [Ambrosiozyma monospora]
MATDRKKPNPSDTSGNPPSNTIGGVPLPELLVIAPLKDPQPSKPSNPTTLGTFDTIDFTDSDENFSSSKPGNASLTEFEKDPIVDSITNIQSQPQSRSPKKPANTNANTWARTLSRPSTIPSRFVKTTGELNDPEVDKPNALDPEIEKKLKDFYSNGMKVDTALKFKIIPTSKDQFPSQEEQFNAMEDSKKENPTLLEFYPNLTNTSIIYINTVGLHPANTFLSGPTEESRKKKLEEESQKLIIKLTATTFSYATNLTFQLEHIDYENTNDIIVANILIPVRLRPLQRYIINDILPLSDFKIILTKSPAAFDQAKLDLDTAQYNVQVLGRVEKDKTVSIPNLFPYKAAKSKMRQAILTSMPSQIFKYEPISVQETPNDHSPKSD